MAVQSVTDTELADFLSRLNMSDGSTLPKFPKPTIHFDHAKPKINLKDVFPESEVTFTVYSS